MVVCLEKLEDYEGSRKIMMMWYTQSNLVGREAKLLCTEASSVHVYWNTNQLLKLPSAHQPCEMQHPKNIYRSGGSSRLSSSIDIVIFLVKQTKSEEKSTFPTWQILINFFWKLNFTNYMRITLLEDLYKYSQNDPQASWIGALQWTHRLRKFSQSTTEQLLNSIGNVVRLITKF